MRELKIELVAIGGRRETPRFLPCEDRGAERLLQIAAGERGAREVKRTHFTLLRHLQIAAEHVGRQRTEGAIGGAASA